MREIDPISRSPFCRCLPQLQNPEFINRIPDAKSSQLTLTLRYFFSFWQKCDQHFTWHLKKQSVATWDLFWDAFRREIARGTHDIALSIAAFWPDETVPLEFQTFVEKKKCLERFLYINVQWNLECSAISWGTRKFNKERIWTSEYFIGLAHTVLTLFRYTTDKNHEYWIFSW